MIKKEKLIRVLPIYIPIREGVLQFIDEEFENKDKVVVSGKVLKKDLAIYLIFFIYNLLNNQEDFHNCVPIYSKLLKKNFLDDYKPYLDFLESISIIDNVRGHDTNAGISRLYGFTDIYYNLNKTYIDYEITDRNLLPKINYKNRGLSEHSIRNNKKCKKLRAHLVKNFDEKLVMNVVGARKEIENYSQDKYDSNSITISQYHKQLWSYSIKPKSDNRLHSILTRTNKKLLKFITYNNQNKSG